MVQLKKLRAGRRRTAVALAVGAMFASGIAYAQQSAGSITGRGAAGDVVTVENKAINISRSVTVDKDGTWQLNQMPSGSYTVTVKRAGGKTEQATVNVSAGQGSNVVFPSALETVTVTGTAIRTIDVASPTTSFALTRAEIDRTPVSQNVTAVTLLAPGATPGDSRFGNLASLGGSSVAENAYYINGFNVTNILKGIAFNEVPFQAIGEIQVLNGGYGAEYGRSLGGVISVNTKRGTDEWKGGVNYNWQPSSMQGRSVYPERSTTSGAWNLLGRPGGTSITEANLYAGGPLIKDTLYVFGLVQATDTKTKTYGQSTNSRNESDTPQYLVKVDWNVNKNNLFELTAFNDKAKSDLTSYEAVSPYNETNGAFRSKDSFESGGKNVIGKWTSYLTEDLTLSGLYGVGKYSRKSRVASAACPAVYDGRPPRTSLEYLGCWSEAAGIALDDPNANDKRTAYRIDLEWSLGKHTIRAGLDNEKYESVDGSVYTGGFYDRLFTLAPGRSIAAAGYTNNTGAPLDYIRERVFRNGGTFETKNSAWYIEDNWQVTKDVMLNLGIRNESFENLNDKGETFIKIKDTWSPRAGIAFDVKGDGQSKLYSNVGRYHIPVYSNTNVRLSGTETFYTDYFAFDGTFSQDGKSIPGKGAQLGTRVVTSNGESKDPRTLVDPNLKPMYQDEFILGYQQAVGNGWALGVKYTNRRLKSSVDDVCEGTLAEEWALGAGYTPDQAAAIGSTVAGCFLTNPGKDLTANVDLDGTGDLTPIRIPASALKNPKAKRTYNAIEFMAERQWDKKWSAQFSYLLSWSRGNTEGYVKSDNGQDDAGITQDFDHPGLMEGSTGYLPNDRRHTFKFSGSYAWTDEWRFGTQITVQSGRPRNCFGNYAGPLPDDSPLYGSASFYCNGVLNPRGSLGRTEWIRDVSLQANYSPMWAKGLSFNVNVLNVFNERGVRSIEEIGEDDGVIGSNSLNYKRPIGIQRPRSFRLSVNYEF